jgi:rhodanese-related sulfurtransferase
MKHSIQSITPQALHKMMGCASPMMLIDVRRAQARLQSGVQLPGATWYDPAAWLDWKDNIANDKHVLVYCAKGHEISQAMTAMCVALGIEAQFLEGGIQAWVDAGLPIEKLAE